MARRGRYGLLAEFLNPQDLLEAVKRAKAEGYRALDAFTPYPVEEISEEVVDHQRSWVPALVLVGALAGVAVALGLQYYVAVVDYPLNVGGRPLFSWPAFIPVTFEMAILFGAFAAVVGMVALNGLPRPHHPLFGVKAFERALQDRYFLLIEAADAKFDEASTRAFLEGLGPVEVHEVDA